MCRSTKSKFSSGISNSNLYKSAFLSTDIITMTFMVKALIAKLKLAC